MPYTLCSSLKRGRVCLPVPKPLPPPTTQTIQPPTKPSYQIASPVKRAKFIHDRPETGIEEALGKLIERDVELVRKLGWEEFVTRRRGRGEMDVRHPARNLLRGYSMRGVPVKLMHTTWDKNQLNSANKRGPHQSAKLYRKILSLEFTDMINASQWVVLPYSIAKNLPNLHISPPGVIPQRDRRPRWICDYTWSGVGPSTIALVP